MSSLAADIGGTVGLWLGFSVFTIFEVAYLALKLFEYFSCSRPQTDNERPRRNSVHRSRQSSRGRYDGQALGGDTSGGKFASRPADGRIASRRPRF